MQPELPFEPEPYEQLKSRFPAAIQRIYSMTELVDQLLNNSSYTNRREHVFDFDDGFRMIVSREDVGLGVGVVTHFSFGVIRHSKAPANSMILTPFSAEEITEKVSKVISSFYGRSDVFKYTTTIAGVHLFFKEHKIERVKAA